MESKFTEAELKLVRSEDPPVPHGVWDRRFSTNRMVFYADLSVIRDRERKYRFSQHTANRFARIRDLGAFQECNLVEFGSFVHLPENADLYAFRLDKQKKKE